MSFQPVPMVYRVSLFTLLVFTLFCCRNDDASLTVIRGNIQFAPAGKIYFYSFADSADIFLERKSAIDSSVVNKNGDYEFKLPLNNSCAFDLICGKKNFVSNLFISPGDKIKIVFTGKENTPHVISEGDAAKYNTYLLGFLDTFYRVPSVKEEYYISTNYMDIQQFATYNDRRKQNQLDFFSDYFKGDSLKKEFRDYANNTINYGIAVDRLMYVLKKRMKGERIELDSSYYSFVTPQFLENMNAFACPAYMRFLNLYIKDVYERKVENGELPVGRSTHLIPAVEKYNLALAIFHHPFREAVLYNILYSDMHDVTASQNSGVSDNQIPDSMLTIFKRKYSLD
jgi:hypothetical protein